MFGEKNPSCFEVKMQIYTMSSINFIYSHILIYGYILILQLKSYKKSTILEYNCKWTIFFPSGTQGSQLYKIRKYPFLSEQGKSLKDNSYWLLLSYEQEQFSYPFVGPSSTDLVSHPELREADTFSALHLHLLQCPTLKWSCFPFSSRRVCSWAGGSCGNATI
jgi:hypothetical protein